MAQSSPPRRRRALIVEDETLFAIGLEADMHALGFHICDLAADGQQACSLAMRNQPDVVLMDISLEGGREGIEVARWLRVVCEAPIVFITGYTDRDTVERIHQQVPGAPVLPKPVYRDRLADAVAAVTRISTERSNALTEHREPTGMLSPRSHTTGSPPCCSRRTCRSDDDAETAQGDCRHDHRARHDRA